MFPWDAALCPHGGSSIVCHRVYQQMLLYIIDIYLNSLKTLHHCVSGMQHYVLMVAVALCLRNAAMCPHDGSSIVSHGVSH